MICVLKSLFMDIFNDLLNTNSLNVNMKHNHKGHVDSHIIEQILCPHIKDSSDLIMI